MKKYLIAGAAALLLSVTGAVAGPTTMIKLSGSNDYFSITRQGDVYAQIHYSGETVVGGGVGMAAVTHDEGTSIIVTDVRTSQTTQHMLVCYNFQRPFVGNGTWVAYGTVDGKTVVSLGSGTYQVLSVHKVAPGPRPAF